MNHRFVRLLVVGVAAGLSGCSSTLADDAGREAAPPVVPGALRAAHEAYLNGDFTALGERIRDVLLDPSSGDPVKQNAFELLDKAYEVQGGRLPSRFKLPEGYGGLQYVIFRNQGDHGASQQIHLRLMARDASHVSGLTVRRLPGETLLDMAGGVGHHQVRHVRAGLDEFVLDSGPVPAPPEDGVLSLRIALDDGTVAEGFAITRALATTATPEVRSPAPWASLADRNPRVAWAPFRSPELAPFEKRALGVQLVRGGELLWETWTERPDDHHDVRAGAAPLEPGEYAALVVSGESRFFGPVELIRGARTAVPFHVTP